MTCSLSGLPIAGGAAVRCLLLTHTPYDDSEHRGSAWIVRTPPLRAVYNDYGSIDSVHPDDEPIKELWMRGLREDLVEQGQGDNEYHDVPTSRGMTFEDLLGAIRLRRVLVTREFEDPARGTLREEHWPRSFRSQVAAVLRAELGDRVRDHQAPGSWCVDEPVPNLARVRYGLHEHADDHMANLHRALELVWKAGLSGDVGAGSGRYGFSPDLIVFPAAAQAQDHAFGPQWDMAPGQTADKKRPLRIGLAMIREDIWQRMTAFPHREYLSLGCLVCGESPSYHARGGLCLDKSYGKPMSHPPGSRYARGTVFPADVEHIVECHGDSEYVSYGLGAFRHTIHAAWQRIADHVAERRWPFWARCDREDAGNDPAPALEPNPERDALIADLTTQWKAKEERRAALPQEARERLLAEEQDAGGRRAHERAHRRERPHFTDFPLRYDDHDDIRGDGVSPGAWILRDSVPGVIGIPEHLAMYLADRTEVPDVVLDGITELAAVRAVAMGVGATWKPAVSSGPQDPEWGEQVRFSRMVLDVALARLAESRNYDDLPTEEAPRMLSVAIDRARRRSAPTTPRNPFRWLYYRLRAERP